MALQVSTIRQAYNCAQDELYAVSLLIMDSFDENQPFFESKKTTYTALFGTDLRTEITDAKTLPDFQQRGAAQEAFKVQMIDMAAKGLVSWQELESLIRDSFPANEFKTRREEAGYTHYSEAASDNWEAVSQLLLSGSTFITNHTAELTTGGMPATFAAEFDVTRGKFDTLFSKFKGAEQSNSEKREEKILANNTYFQKITNLCEDGKKYYRDDPAKRERFTFSKVLGLVSSPGTTTITVDVLAGQSVTTDDVVLNSAIINGGVDPVFVCSGSAACDVLSATSIPAGDQVTNTFGHQVTLTNNSAGNVKVKLRVTAP